MTVKLQKCVDNIVSLCDQINDRFLDTAYENLGKAMESQAKILKQAMDEDKKSRPTLNSFLEGQEQLLIELKETQALINLSMDQQRPMTYKQTADYLSVSIDRLRTLIKRKKFPQPYRPATGEGLLAGEYFRKHEIDTFLFKHENSFGKSLTVVETNNMSSATTRAEIARKARREFR